MMLHKNTIVIIRLSNDGTDFLYIIAKVELETLSPYLFIVSIDYVLRMLVDLTKENGLSLKQKGKKQTTSRKNY